MQTHNPILIAGFLAISIAGCRNEPKQNIPVIPRDTTITVENAFTQLTLDSQFVYQYVTDNIMSDTTRQLLFNFYNSRNYQYAWFDENGPSEHANMVWNFYQRSIELAGDTGKTHKKLEQVFTADSTMRINPADKRDAELQFTELFFNYAFSAYVGSVKPEELQWYIPRKKVDVTELLDSLLSEKRSIQEWEPVHPQYKLLRNELLKYYDWERKGGWERIDMAKNKKLVTGAKDSIILFMKKRLHFTGDYPDDDTSLLFTSQLKDSIVSVQKRFGLTADGAISESLAEQLNVPVENRIQQLLINMERLRWVPEQPSGTWILANIPSFRLQVYQDDSIALQMKIVVGAAATKTVIFSNELKYIVFSPYWNVPPSIVRNEILPAMKRNPGYLKNSNMEQTGTSNGLPVVRQKPGPQNALGLVKFLFPNNYNIYFHDTPAKSYFERTDRAFSHGCIRLGEPFNLAKFLLRNDSSWTDKKIRAAMNDKKEKWVPLQQHIPVFITYFTAWVDAEGNLQFRKDIYGHDSRMAEHLFRM